VSQKKQDTLMLITSIDFIFKILSLLTQPRIFYKISIIYPIIPLSASEMTYIVSSGALNSTHYYYPLYLKDVAALPCETEMFQKSYRFNNTVCECTYLISFSRQIKFSIKNYEISFRIKYSVRHLIYDVHLCARAARMQYP